MNNESTSIILLVVEEVCTAISVTINWLAGKLVVNVALTTSSIKNSIFGATGLLLISNV